MQSIIALAGLVSLATASIAPLYDNKTGTSTLAATFTTPLAWYTTEYITTSAFTTYCPEATTLTLGTRTLTVTSATTLTVTDCNSGCEIVRPLPTTTIEQTTEIVRTTALETYCPEPTTLTFSTRTYTVTKAMTLTIPHTVTAVSTITAVIPVQPTKTNSTCVKPSKYSTPAPEAPTTPVIPVIPVIPVTPVTPAPTTPAPTTPAPTTPIVPTVTPVPTDDEDEDLQVIEPFIPSTETLSAVITTAPLSTLVLKPTGDNATFTTKPTLYTGAANRMGAGALVAAAGFAVLF